MARDDDAPLPIPSGLDWASPSPDEPGRSADRCDVRLVQLGDQKISVIRVVREFFGLGLADAKQLVESAPVTLAEDLSRELANRVVNALADAGATACIAGEEATTQGGFATVILNDHGPRKIAIIKLIREVTGLGLKDAKQLSETPGAAVAEGIPRDRAEHIVERITEQHGIATIRDASEPAALFSGEEHVTLVLTHTGPKKINIIKIIREASGLGLKECKDMSENVPAIITTRLAPERAERALAEIREAGGDGRIDG